MLQLPEWYTVEYVLMMLCVAGMIGFGGAAFLFWVERVADRAIARRRQEKRRRARRSARDERQP